ncbi:right-handed parallel beta-helix repeat-containing protein [Rugosimonospora africana]|uniref:Right handed beta helix domain-containing protein n=1 Tax=Rugosimonospora africana TaxID=556532 RepID=A0A8J3QYH6_9ACTN|nr:right-handed parallel beta-helix repeat-containing protein [Rugosimonospora africana]GIH19740.1 hypothetical protein Raf01_79120 [Rugosimonospora africana]
MRTTARIGLRAAAGAVLALSAVLATHPVPVAAQPAVFTLYLSPTGSNSNTGSSPASPLATLDGAQAALVAADPHTDVEVRIGAGTYVATGAPARWRFYVPGHSISFLPATYRPGRITPQSQRPVFHGPDTPAWWFQANLPDGSPGGDTNLRFVDLIVEHYSAGGMTIAGPTGVDENGVAVPTSAGLNHNVVSGMTFRDGGSLYVPSHYGWGALDFVNSSDNLIVGNLFERLENSGADGLMHGVYLAHDSSRNTVVGNQFVDISNDPVRVRNDSDDNRVYANVFVRAGADGFVTDWFCDATCVAENPGHTRECASHGNVFHDNELVSGYTVKRLAVSHLFVGDNDYPGEAGCDNHGQPRILAWSNHGPSA